MAAYREKVYRSEVGLEDLPMMLEEISVLHVLAEGVRMRYWSTVYCVEQNI